MTRLKLTPLVGICTFVLLYIYSASLYPGGQKFDATTTGYDHFNNYWCDLMDQPTYSGADNPATTIALTSIILLALSLLPFFFYLPTLFRKHKFCSSIVRYFGMIAMVLTALMPLAHDQVIAVAGPVGLIAFGASVYGLFRNRYFKLALAALIAVGFAGANFFMWKTAFYLEWMPMVQKFAFLSIFLWIGLTTRELLRHS